MFEIPCRNGNLAVDEKLYDELTHTYPNIKIDVSLKKLCSYLKFNPDKQRNQESLRKHIKTIRLPMMTAGTIRNFVNSILQCGYFVLIAAVKAFESGEYKFTTYLNYSVQNVVNEAINGKSRQPSKVKEYSYNRTVVSYDGDETEMIDLMKDEQAEYKVFEPLELTDVQQIVITAVAELPEREKNIICCHYFHNMTFKEIAECQGYNISNIRQYERRAFYTLRKNRKLCFLFAICHTFQEDHSTGCCGVIPILYAIVFKHKFSFSCGNFFICCCFRKTSSISNSNLSPLLKSFCISQDT